MIAEAKLSELLYQNRKKELTHFPGLSVGSLGPAGIGISKHRSAGYGGAKISSIARVVESLLDKNIKAICGKDSVCVEFMSSIKTSYLHKAICDGASIKFVGEKPEKNWEQLIPLVIYETRPEGKNKELIDAMNALPDKTALLLMCDSFYYGCAQGKSITISYNETPGETVNAALRSGLWKDSHKLCELLSESSTVETPYVAKEEVKDIENFDDIRSGKHAIAYSWSKEQRNRIPSLNMLDDFVPTAAFWKGSRKIKYRTDKVLMRMDSGLTRLDALGKDVINFFMTGKPGTGKTTVAKALAAAYQIPFYSIPIQKGTEEGTFQGLLKARDGKFEFVSTDFLDAFKNGGVIVLEELNLADPAILSGAIGQAVESPYFVLEDELRPVYRHPLCIIIGTFNVGTAGSKEINPMLSSRFYQTYVVNDPDENEFIERLTKFDCTRVTAKKIYTAYSRILDYLRKDDVNALEDCKNVTFRGCVGAIQSLQEGASLKEAIEDTLVGKIAEYDLELAEDVLKNVVETLPD